MKPGPRPSQQARSRRMMQRLVTATVDLIEERGLAGATIPEIARAAGVSTGSVYRRFTDKDGLVRTAFLQILEASQAAAMANLPRDRFRGQSLAAALRDVGRGLVAQYRGRTGLLRALDQFLETQGDAEFRERAVGTIEANIRLLADALLIFRDQIAHADPERAIAFALLTGMTVVEVHKLQAPLLWQRMLPLDDDALARETARAMAAYLTTPDRSPA